MSLDAAILEDNPQLPEALRSAWDEAVALLATNPDPTLALMADPEAISFSEMEVLLSEVQLLTWAEQATHFEQGSIDLQCLHAAQLMADLGLISDPTAAFGCAARNPG